MSSVHDFDSYDPSAWQEGGLLISPPIPPRRAPVGRHVPWVAAMSLVFFVNLNGIVSIPADRLHGAFASSLDERPSPQSSDVDSDLVEPGYWTQVKRLAERMPRLPPETDETDPELPDLDL